MNEAFTILVVEDDPGHAALVERGLRRAGVRNPVLFFEDGDEVLAFLGGAGPQPHFELGRHYLMLLDIRLPRVGGLEVLRRVRTDARFAELPVVMLTTTEEQDEVDAAHALDCTGFLTKPVEHARFVEVVRRAGLVPFLDVPARPAAQPGRDAETQAHS